MNCIKECKIKLRQKSKLEKGKFTITDRYGTPPGDSLTVTMQYQ